MITFFGRFLTAFLWDELAFVRWVRGLMLALAAGGAGFADQLAAAIGSSAPRTILAIKVLALVCGFFGGAITAGERNPKPGRLS